MQRVLRNAVAWEPSPLGSVCRAGIGRATMTLFSVAPADRQLSHSGSSSSSASGGGGVAEASRHATRIFTGAFPGARHVSPYIGEYSGSMNSDVVARLAPAVRIAKTTSAPVSPLHAKARRAPTFVSGSSQPFASGSSQPEILSGDNADAVLDRTSVLVDEMDPFALVASELDFVSQRIIHGIKTQIPALSSAAEYFFQLGSEGKRLRPTVLLLMSTVLARDPWSKFDAAAAGEGEGCPTRNKQQRIAEITEMIHVASLLHDDVIDMASTRRGKKSLNALVGGKMSILAGDFLLARASVTLARLKNTEVVEVLSKVIEDLVTGEVMQLSAIPEQLTSFEFYTRKTYCKTASLFANSCKAVAMLSESAQADVDAAYEFGMHLGLAFQYVDDVLDFTGTEEGMGKDSLADLGVRLTGIAAHTRTRARTPLAFGHPFHVCASAHASGTRTSQFALR